LYIYWNGLQDQEKNYTDEDNFQYYAQIIATNLQNKCKDALIAVEGTSKVDIFQDAKWKCKSNNQSIYEKMSLTSFDVISSFIFSIIST